MIPEPNTFQNTQDILNGAILIIDKPLDWTSFDVVGKLKWLMRRFGKAPKFKIGHAGTLDPLATGLLVVCTGRCTKMIPDIQGGMKEYTGTIRLGQTTPSYDLETAPEGAFPYEHFTEAELRGVAASFIGEQLQTPPIYSAKLIDGKRAYESARAGIAIEMKQAQITIFEFELTRIALPDVDFRIRCSKGTYIRSIAHDFGQRLQSGSHLIALRRTGSLPYHIDQAITVEEAERRIKAQFEAS